MRRQVTDTDIEAIWRRLAPIAVADFNACGQFPPLISGIRLGANPGEIEFSSLVPEEVVASLFSGPARLRQMYLRLLVNPSADRPPELQDAHVDIALAISEAWSCVRPIDDDCSDLLRQGAVSEQPDRKECLAFMFRWAESGGATGICWIDPATRKASMGSLIASMGS